MDAEEEINLMLDAVPQLNNAYTIIEKIGEGTFSSVYKVKEKCDIDEPKARLFALKYLVPTCHPTRAETELKCLLDVGGAPNIIGISAYARNCEHIVFVMPFFQHDKFADYVDKLSMEEIRLYIKALLIALETVHKFNYIHRDVKPGNFLFNRSTRRFALVDFGLAQSADDVRIKNVEEPQAQAYRKEKVAAHPIKTFLKENAFANKTSSPSSTGIRPLFAVRQRSILAPLHSNSQFTPRSSKNLFNSFARPSISLIPSTHIPSSPLPHYLQSLFPKNTLTKPLVEFSSKKTINETTPTRSTLKRKDDVISSNSNRRTKMRSERSAKEIRDCDCGGNYVVCDICTGRPGQQAARAGTPGFRAPEVLLKYPYQTSAIDMWSVGVILFMLLCRKTAVFSASDDVTSLAELVSVFGSDVIKNLANKYEKCFICEPEYDPINLSEYCNTVRKAVKGTEKASSDTTPDAAIGLLRHLLCIDPSLRITAPKALQHPFMVKKSHEK